MAKTVLIVDDRVYVRAALRGFLALRTDLEVCGEAADGFDALVQARNHRPDLVLIDLSMPRMNGVEAAAIIRNMLPGARIIMFTLSDDLATQAAAKKAGVDLIISKAEGATGLSKALESLLADEIHGEGGAVMRAP